MTPLVRRFLKSAIVFLITGLLVGLWLSAWQHLGLFPGRYPSVAAHTHLLLVGFVMMTIMGVALWMFPRPAAQDERYRPRRMELVWWLLVVAVPVRSLAEIVSSWSADALPHRIVFAASAAEVLAIGIFFQNLWRRIRSPREEYLRAQERPGEPE